MNPVHILERRSSVLVLLPHLISGKSLTPLQTPLAISNYLQATWLPNVYQSTSSDTMYALMSNLKNEGVQRVYVDVWNNGITYFESATMRNAVGASGIGADHLQWALDAGRILDIEVYAWFEYGLMTSYGAINNDFAQHAQDQGWLLGLHNNFYWMDPENMDVLSFIGGIMTDAIKEYGS